MTEQDKEHMRILFAGFAMCGAIMSRDNWTPKQIWDIADDMIENMDQSSSAGLPPIRTRKAKAK